MPAIIFVFFVILLQRANTNLTIYSLMLSLALVFGPLPGSVLLSVLSIRWIYIMLCFFAISAFFFAVKIHVKSKRAIKKKLGGYDLGGYDKLT